MALNVSYYVNFGPHDGALVKLAISESRFDRSEGTVYFILKASHLIRNLTG